MLGYVIAALTVFLGIVNIFEGNIAGALILFGIGGFCAWTNYEAIKADRLLKELNEKEEK